MRMHWSNWERVVVGCALVGVVGLFGVGCSEENPAGGTGGTGSGGDTGNRTGGDGGTEMDGTEGDGTSEACQPKSKYLQVIQPNVYILFDRSDSMEGQKLRQAKSGLDQVADSVADQVRVGMSIYPEPSCCCSRDELLELGEHSPGEIKSAYADLEAAGGTPTAAAFSLIREAGSLSDPEDEFDNRRSKAVVLVTDGEPNDEEVCPNSAKEPVDQVERLADEGVQTFVVGYQSEADPATLNALAEAGGTDAPGSSRFYQASDGAGLAGAIEDITGSELSCSFQLDPTPPEGTSVNVTVGEEEVPGDGFEFDDSSGIVELLDPWCSQIRDQASQGVQLNIDVGCPGCSVAGESCSSDADCCGDGFCEGGVCKEPCRTLGEECISSGECCSEECGSSEEREIGECTQG